MKRHKGRSLRDSFDSKRSGAELAGHAITYHHERKQAQVVDSELIQPKTELDDLLMNSVRTPAAGQLVTKDSLPHLNSEV